MDNINQKPPVAPVRSPKIAIFIIVAIMLCIAVGVGAFFIGRMTAPANNSLETPMDSPSPEAGEGSAQKMLDDPQDNTQEHNNTYNVYTFDPESRTVYKSPHTAPGENEAHITLPAPEDSRNTIGKPTIESTGRYLWYTIDSVWDGDDERPYPVPQTLYLVDLEEETSTEVPYTNMHQYDIYTHYNIVPISEDNEYFITIAQMSLAHDILLYRFDDPSNSIDKVASSANLHFLSNKYIIDDYSTTNNGPNGFSVYSIPQGRTILTLSRGITEDDTNYFFLNDYSENPDTITFSRFTRDTGQPVDPCVYVYEDTYTIPLDDITQDSFALEDLNGFQAEVKYETPYCDEYDRPTLAMTALSSDYENMLNAAKDINPDVSNVVVGLPSSPAREYEDSQFDVLFTGNSNGEEVFYRFDTDANSLIRLNPEGTFFVGLTRR